ncbi:hypothetical protein Pcinc_041613 [Petrolisthes cinctipes]|uniref:Uncharacterized protein n=1 Tax=Petrolisthes cinctipes TaxID=88211 RepID=A0AAE1BJ90_PETCI|nr:hypothetical protein Pcinc_041613 [Petrolisthes cinctipes]
MVASLISINTSTNIIVITNSPANTSHHYQHLSHQHFNTNNTSHHYHHLTHQHSCQHLPPLPPSQSPTLLPTPPTTTTISLTNTSKQIISPTTTTISLTNTPANTFHHYHHLTHQHQNKRHLPPLLLYHLNHQHFKTNNNAADGQTTCAGRHPSERCVSGSSGIVVRPSPKSLPPDGTPW